MSYFNPYPLCIDDTVTTAWKGQVTEAAKTPSLAEVMAQRGSELFPRFAATYTKLRALRRGARRTLQRRLAHSRELSTVLQEWLQQKSGGALQHKLATTLAGAALLLALGQGASEAATIKVTTTNPVINDSDGKCSLIEAIINANADAAVFSDCPPGSGPDRITLPAKSTHTLTYAYDSTYGPTGLPLISSPITIAGNGGKIVRDKQSPDFRLIAVDGAGDLRLQNVTLIGGSISEHYGYGSGVFNFGGNVTIEKSTISGNVVHSDSTRAFGGGVYNSGYLTIENSTISGNKTVSNNFYSRGGGVYNSGYLAIRNSALSGNTVSTDSGVSAGGGLYNSGTITIENSTFSGNTGSAVSNHYYGTFTIRNSTIAENIGGAFTSSGEYLVGVGGGVYNAGHLTIENSTVWRNSASYGGGVFNYGYLTIENSTISGNAVRGDSGWASGGGIYNEWSLTIENSTISGNTVSSDSGWASGGGIYSFGAYLTITHSTISGNTVSSNSYYADGGGINVAGGTLIIENSTISGNTVSSNSYHADGGGIHNGGLNYTYVNPFRILYKGGSLTITHSTISGNTVKSASNRANGGGIRNGAILYTSPSLPIYHQVGNITITDSTISGNSVRSHSSDAFGGGVSNYGDVTIENSTVSGNTARSGSYPSEGGGVYNRYTLTLNGTLISGNKAAAGREIFNYGGASVYADNFNLFGKNGDSGLYGLSPGASDLVPNVKLNKILGPLKNNGGSTKTHALPKGSPAIDAAPADSECPATDQRGVPRPRGAGCDIGAFEQ